MMEKIEGFRYSLSTIQEINDYEEYINNRSILETISEDPDYSPMTTFYYFNNKEIYAKIDCRWDLSKGNLSEEGGHVGFITAPKYREKGIMFELLKFALLEYKKKNIKKVFITALKDNIASRSTIEKVGGIFDSYHERKDGEIIARYWVDSNYVDNK